MSQPVTGVKQFLINTSHYVGNNTYRYNFPQGRKLDLNSKTEIALSSISIYNSTFNIKESWGNNKIVIFSNEFNLNATSLNYYENKGSSYTDPVSGLVIATKYVQLSIPDGYWDISSIELFLQQQFELMGFYLVSADGQSNMFFVECLTNPQRYKTQINLFTIPEDLPYGFVMPPNPCFALPSQSSSASVYFPSVNSYSKYGNLGKIFGFNSNVILPLNNDTTIESNNLSQVCPTVSPISTYIVCCNLVNNPLTVPSDVLMQLNLGSSKFGGIVPYNDYPEYIACEPQQASSIVITLYDENYNQLEINDPQFSMILSVKYNS